MACIDPKKIPGWNRGAVGLNHPGKDTEATFSNCRRFGLIAAKKPSMRQVLRELNVRFTTSRVTSWQRVKCPVCGYLEALTLLHGKHGEGVFVCHGCGTKGDSIATYRRATGRSFRDVCVQFGAWGEL